MRGRLAAAAVLVLAVATAAAAQFGPRGGFGGFGGFFGRFPPKFPTADTFGHGFVFCRGIYTSGRREAGGTGWSTDFPARIDAVIELHKNGIVAAAVIRA